MTMTIEPDPAQRPANSSTNARALRRAAAWILFPSYTSQTGATSNTRINSPKKSCGSKEQDSAAKYDTAEGRLLRLSTSTISSPSIKQPASLQHLRVPSKTSEEHQKQRKLHGAEDSKIDFLARRCLRSVARIACCIRLGTNPRGSEAAALKNCTPR